MSSHDNNWSVDIDYLTPIIGQSIRFAPAEIAKLYPKNDERLSMLFFLSSVEILWRSGHT